MTRIFDVVSAIRRRLESHRLRHLPVALAAVGAIGAAMLLGWLPDQAARLERREMAVQRNLKVIESDLAEVDRLRLRKPAAEVPIGIIREALSSSLPATAPSLSVTAVDADHLRIQGSGEFDGIIRWLADAQQTHGLSVTRASIVRQSGDVVVDIGLSRGHP